MSSDPAQLIGRLKCLADLTRMRLIALCQQGECSVTELANVIGQSQPRISQHLKMLCDAGLLARQRDGQRVYYRLPARGPLLHDARELLYLIPQDHSTFEDDSRRLRTIRGVHALPNEVDRRQSAADRAVFRAILDMTVTAPVGALLDVGCGRGQILKLLASRASRAVGVDIDAEARLLARAELLLASVPNCSLRQGDMYRLPFADAEFDTIVLDDVLATAARPVAALREASRLLRPGGRLLLLTAVDNGNVDELRQSLAEWGQKAELRLARPRIATPKDPRWLLAVATSAGVNTEAA